MNAETESLICASVLEDVMRMGEAAYWRRRAEDFEWAKPRLGEYQGQASNAELSARWNRCHQAAEACRHRALVVEGRVA